MINLTDKPVILVQAEALNAAVREALRGVLLLLETQHGKAPNPPVWKRSDFSFEYLFSGVDRLNNTIFDEKFINAAFDFVQAPSRNVGTQEARSILDQYHSGHRYAASAFPSLRSGLKLLLVQLWEDRALLLPSIFTMGTTPWRLESHNQLFQFVLSYGKEPNRPGGAAPLRKADSHRLYYFGPRLIWTTDWNRAEDVSIYELADLHRSQLLYIAGKHPYAIAGPSMPWTLLLSELFRTYQARVRFGQKDIERYTRWIVMRQHHEFSFRDFTEKHEELERLHHEKQKKRYAANGVRLRERSKDNPRELKKTKNDILQDLSKMRTHDAVLDYFKAAVYRARSGLNWLKQVPSYPGREYISLADISVKWREVFEAFLRFRLNVKGYEKSQDTVSVLNLLGDYLFLYLPWWKEIYPEGRVCVPQSPREFTRYVFVYRTADDPVGRMPRTLLEMIKLRRRTHDSEYIAIKQLALFFRFVESHYSDNEAIAGKDFRNPIFEEFDLPRLKKHTKTTKVVIPKGVYGYLLFYGYAVEAFGEYLLQQALSESLPMSRGMFRDKQTFRADKLGFIPLVRYRGQLYPVFSVPNIFVWAERTVKTSQGDEKRFYIPHLTTLRLLLSAVETGLRLQSIQWLDIRHFDSLNKISSDKSIFSYEPHEHYIYRLLVNTDKTRNEPWVTEIVYRVRCLLLRESEFQRMISNPAMDEEVPYEGRESSRFAPMVPLFKSASSKIPAGDHIYQRYWREFLAAFESFYAEIANGQKTSFVTLRPIVDVDGNVKTAVKNGRLYCPLSLRAIHTPHACRATYATNRQGILETSDIAAQLGHRDEVATTYYQKHRVEDMQARLEEADKAVLADFGVFDRNNATYVRADKPDSALVKGFSKDREATIKHFGFMPTVTLWSSEESKSNDPQGNELLRSGPMSLLKFRETHICPVGEECPSDVIAKIGTPKRCGLCPLAMKCVDHLPAISAKKNELIERIRYLDAKRRRLEQSGEPTAVIDAIWDQMELDTNEFLGWQLSEEILLEIYKKISLEGHDTPEFHAERPDIVRRHLQVAVRKTPQVEFLLKRIAEANAYPSMETPQIQAVAARVRRRILAGSAEGYSEYITDAADEVLIAAKLLKTVMATRGVSLEHVAGQMQEMKLPSHQTPILGLEQK